jgi:pSer/pThr/pTyr-binding forkhead associated (FHA) protein
VPRFVLIHEGRRIPLPDGETLIGRGLSCRIRFNDPAMSREHLRVVVRGSRAQVTNLGSNGTLINGARLAVTHGLCEGDELRLGFQRIRVEVFEEPELPTIEVEERPSVTMRMEAEEFTQPGEDGWRRRRVDEDFMVPTRLAEIRIPPTRRDPRFPVVVPVIYTSATLIIDAVVHDLSRGGMFIATEVLDPIGTPCDVTAMPEGHSAVVFEGVVAHVADEPGKARVPGLGIHLVKGSPDAMRWLDRTIAVCSEAVVEPASG